MTTPAQYKMAQLSEKNRLKEEKRQEEKYIVKQTEKNLKSSNQKFENSPYAEKLSWQREEDIEAKKQAALDKWDAVFFATMDKKFSKYVGDIAKLKTTIPGDYTIERAPIIPATNQIHFMKQDLLKEAGIFVVHVADYAIFENQFLLGINFKKLIKGHSALEAFQNKCDEYKEKISALNDKLKILDDLQERINFIQEHLDVAYKKKQEAEFALSMHKMPLKNADEKELEMYEHEHEHLQEQVNSLTDYYNIRSTELNDKIKHKDGISADLDATVLERNDLVLEYRAYRQTGNAIIHSGPTDFSTKVWNAVEGAVSQINAKLGFEDQICFPETGQGFGQAKFDPSTKAGKPGLTGKRPTMNLHGDIAYYWVMKQKELNAWNEHVGGGTIMHGWAFPKKSIVARMKGKNAQNEAKLASKKLSFEDEIDRLKRLKTPKDKLLLKMKNFLIEEGIKWGDEWTTKFEAEFMKNTSMRMSTMSNVSENNPFKYALKKSSSLIKPK